MTKKVLKKLKKQKHYNDLNKYSNPDYLKKLSLVDLKFLRILVKDDGLIKDIIDKKTSELIHKK